MSCQLSQATEIINWFNNHSQAFTPCMLSSVLFLNYHTGHFHSFQPVITQGTSHIMSIEWLLKLQMAFRSIVMKHEGKLENAAGMKCEAVMKAHQIIGTINNMHFGVIWNSESPLLVLIITIHSYYKYPRRIISTHLLSQLTSVRAQAQEQTELLWSLGGYTNITATTLITSAGNPQ